MGETPSGRFDGMFFAIAEQHQSITGLFDELFGFLVRKTDFFTGAQSVDDAKAILLKSFDAHAQKALAEKEKFFAEEKEKDRRNEERRREEERRQQQQQQQPKLIQQEERPKIEEIIDCEEDTETSNAIKRDNKENEKLTPSSSNGSKTDRYEWSQSLQTVDALIELPFAIAKASMLNVKLTKDGVCIKLKNDDKPILEGEWYSAIKAEECVWYLSEKKYIQISLQKDNEMEWWSCLLKGDPEIDCTKIVPENSKLSDLDPELRKTVEKMMFDQNQKQKGLPTSDQLEQQNIFEKFKKAHPEMDFSQAKFSY